MKHTVQLTGRVTESVDCGPASVRTAISWATRDAKVPSIRAIRRRMGLAPAKLLTTNPSQWARAIESFDTPGELAGKYERLTGTVSLAGRWEEVERHLRDGKLAIVAVDYGVYRRSMPRKAGSLSFDGYHAIPFKAERKGRTKSFDPLLDGRYRGCPRGPVMVPLAKVERAAEAIGRKEAGSPSVYAYLVDRATRLGTGVDIPEPEEPLTLTSILADLADVQDRLSDTELGDIIGDLEDLIGPYEGDADPGDDPAPGVEVKAA